MDKFSCRSFKLNKTIINFPLFSLLFIILLMTFFFDNSKSLLENINANTAWADVDPNQDTDKDGISDKLELENDPNRDTDGDQIKDYLDPDTCTMPTFTGNGYITLHLCLFKCESDKKEDCRIIEDKNTYLTKCRAIGPGDIDLPSSYGDFPYGLWGFRINITREFDPNIHSITMEIYFPGQIDPLNAQYWAQEYDIVKKKVEWIEYDQDLFDPNVTKHTVTIRLLDSKPSEKGDIQPGIGDSDPNEWVIDHVGGLLWPIPGGGRCFIDQIWSIRLH